MQEIPKFISVENISKTYNLEPPTGIQNINFEIEKGKIYIILGESGSGKSTLLRCIFGLISPDNGKVLYQGQKVLGPEYRLIPGHEAMRLVTQDSELNTFATVYDNIAAEFSNKNLEEKHQKTESIIDVLKLTDLKKHKIKTLSGGEQQRVALAKAMVTLPPILLLDEPFSQIDTLLKKQLREDILNLKTLLGTTVIMVSHDPLDAYYLADEVLILKNGNLLQKGNVETIKNNPNHHYTACLFGNAYTISQNDSWNNYAHKTNVTGKSISIYPEDIIIHKQPIHHFPEAIITEIRHMGFYTEIKIGIFEQELKCYDLPLERTLQIGQSVWIEFKKFITFD